MDKATRGILALVGLTLAVVSSSALGQAMFAYGSSDAVLTKEKQEIIFAGFELGFKSTLKGGVDPAQVLTVLQQTDGAQLGAIQTYKELVAKKVAAIGGYPSSHAALLVGELAKRSGVPTIFAGVAHSGIVKFGPTVFSTGPSMASLAEAISELVAARFPQQKGLVVVNPQAAFSLDQRELLRASSTENKRISTDEVELRSDLTLPPEAVQKLKRKAYRYLTLTQYPNEAVALLEQLQREGVDIPIVANSSWVILDIDLVRRFLNDRKSPLYSVTLWVPGSKESSGFEKLASKSYGKSVSSGLAIGYDLGVILASLANRIGVDATPEKVLATIKDQPCFEGLSCGRLCLSPTGGHAKRKIWPIRYDQGTFVSEAKLP